MVNSRLESSLFLILILSLRYSLVVPLEDSQIFSLYEHFGLVTPNSKAFWNLGGKPAPVVPLKSVNAMFQELELLF